MLEAARTEGRQTRWSRARNYAGDHAVLLVGCVTAAAALADRALIRSDPAQLLAAPTASEWVGVVAMFILAIIAVVITGFYRRWMFWSPPQDESLVAMVVGAIVAVFVLVQVFAALTAVAAQSGWLTVSGFDYERGDTGSSGSGGTGSWLGLGDPDVYQAMERQYLWHVLDAVPSLDVPETVNWDKPRHELTGYAGGVVALVFKLLVVVPAIALGVQLWERARPDKDAPG